MFSPPEDDSPMAVQCPYCKHAVELKGAKPGKFTAKCPRCERKYLLAIPEDPAQPPVVSGIKSERLKCETAPAPAQGGAARPQTPAGGETEVWESPAPAPGTADPLATAAMPGSTPRAEQGEATAVHIPSTPAAGLPRTQPAPTDGRAAGLHTRDAGAIDGDTLGLTVGPVPEQTGAAGGLPPTIGPYQVLRELGQGGMGAVYLARQLSLNRNVALKVMKPEWANDATFLARFTREAYAAAQLTHHNIVQIYDFGEDEGTAYFSMEFVDGVNLAGLVRQKTRLDVEEAAGYVLQAARGLKFAHDQSLIHRDVKPENLLLNRHGVVKVADLGLVKTPEVAAAEADAATAGAVSPTPTAAPIPTADDPGRITRANVAMGTPAFMAPEQARDAARVDARADIYSLGCTLYDLVTGRPPFEGRTVMEIMTKHQTEPVTPPEMVVKRVPRALSEIIMRMVAKKPEDRFADLSQVIRSLEDFLGLQSGGPFTPREEHANLLEECVQTFNASPMARLRGALLPVGVSVCGLLVVLFALAHRPATAGAFLGLGLVTSVAYFVVRGLREKTPTFLKVSELVLSSPLTDWLMAAAVLALGGVVLFVTGQLWVWAAMAVVGVLTAVGLHVGLDRTARAERAEALEKAEAMLRSMRLQGLDEDALRQFVCKYSGDRWEEFYEALFGYEAKLAARARWGRGDRGQTRPRFAPWREPMIAWLDARVRGRREAREKAKLEKIEERSLCAQGENLVTARRKARRTAAAMVATASEIRHSADLRGRPDPSVSIARALQDAAARPEKVLVNREKGLYGESRSRLDLILGPKPRLLAGLALLAGCLTWMYQNEVVSANQARALADAAREAAAKVDTQALAEGLRSGDLGKAADAATRGTEKLQREAQKGYQKAQSVRNTRTVKIPLVPNSLAVWLSSFGAGAAGLVLMVSSFFGGTRIALFALPAAAVMMLGPNLGLPTFGLDPSLAPIAIGGGVLAVGILFGRGRG
jgi:serine/threonine protein kinase